jgi:aspartokinase-like uncharacterized kinase
VSGLRGFTQYNFDVVIKVGGSLLADLGRLESTMREIDRLRSEGLRPLIVPGGGPTDNEIERIYALRPFGMETAHRACALAQDQTGLMLCGASLAESLEPCDTLDAAIDATLAGRSPVILPSALLLAAGPIERTWDVTSDSVAGWFAWLTNTPRLAILTNVDGVYRPGHVGEPASLLQSVRAADLAAMGHTAVDVCLPGWIAAGRVGECAVINGWHSERLRQWINGEAMIGTIIRP